jgi:hypothetical protein
MTKKTIETKQTAELINAIDATASVSALEFGIRAIRELDRGDKVMYGANKLVLCALIKGHYDTVLPDGLSVGAYHVLDGKKQKMIWREAVYSMLFGLSKDDIEERHKFAISSVLPIAELLIKEGYELTEVDCSLKDVNLSEERRVIYNHKTHDLYLPAFIAVQDKHNESLNSPYRLVKVQTSFAQMTKTAKKALNYAPQSGRKRASESKVNTNDTVSKDSFEITASNNGDTTSISAPSFAALFRATVAALESRELIEFDNDARLELYKIYQQLDVQLPDDVKLDLIDDNLDIETERDFNVINNKLIKIAA